MDQNIKEIFDLLRDQIFWIDLRWKIFKQIYGKKENVELINEFAPVCFKFFQDASFDIIILSINRLLDQKKTYGKKNNTLFRLKSMIEEKECKDLNSELEDIKCEIEKNKEELRELRHKKIGHNDLETMKSNYESLSGVTRKQIDLIIENIRKFMNKISIYFDGKEIRYDYGSKGKEGEKLVNYFKMLKEY